MKELSVEEKAKAYDKAVERAKEINNEHKAQPFDVMLKVFPELKESEDERIKKIIEVSLKSYFDGTLSEGTNDTDYAMCLTWLEKQGDKDRLIKELGEYKVKYTQGVLEQHLNGVNRDNERLIKTTIAFLKEFADKGYENAVECIDWLEKQGEKVEPIEGFNTEFERQVSCLIASIINKEHEYTEAFVKWTSDALLNYAKREIENRNGQKSKKVSLWKHWKNGIAGNGEGKLIYLVKEGNTYSLSSCLGFECDYIELSELDSLMFGKPCEQKPAISDEAIREGIVHFGITQYQIDNWLKKYIDVEEQGQDKQKQDISAQINLNPSEYINDMGGNGCYLKNTAQKPVDEVEPKQKTCLE